MKLDLTVEGARALREFSEVLPSVLEELASDTEELINVYSTVSESIGPHEESFNAMLRSVANAQKVADEAVQVMPAKMTALAEAIEDFVRKSPSV